MSCINLSYLCHVWTSRTYVVYEPLVPTSCMNLSYLCHVWTSRSCSACPSTWTQPGTVCTPSSHTSSCRGSWSRGRTLPASCPSAGRARSSPTGTALGPPPSCSPHWRWGPSQCPSNLQIINIQITSNTQGGSNCLASYPLEKASSPNTSNKLFDLFPGW